MRTDNTVTVTSAEFHRNIGTYQDIALTKAVTITKNGRERTVLISAEGVRAAQATGPSSGRGRRTNRSADRSVATGEGSRSTC